MLSAEDVRSHSTMTSCWVIIAGQAYDVTTFLDKHPGGVSSILRYAGRDATADYEPIHPAGTLEKHLALQYHLGPVSGSNDDRHAKPQQEQVPEQQAPLSVLQNLNDFEAQAQKYLSRKAWIYYSSAADSLTSYRNNLQDWDRITLRPRVLRNVSRISMKRNIMGVDSSLPFFVAPAAMAKLGHEDGELCLVSGAARHNIPYCCSTYSSVAHSELASRLETSGDRGALIFQLYVPIAKQDAKKLIAEARRLNFKALVVTVDSAVIGKREEDDRYKAELDHEAGVEVSRTTNTDSSDEAPILRGAHSSTLDWDDLEWIRDEWAGAGPIVLKGIQTVEDAVRAARAGVDGIYLSNHGGRQLDHAPSSIRTLLEIRAFAPELLEQLEIYMDGGIRRGTDIIKALALGARAVALGRPFMYALSGYGTDGVCKAIQLLSDELETSLRLMGLTDIDQLRDYHVNSTALELELPRRIETTAIVPSKL